MSLFEDKKFNEMDWLSQAVEPIVSSLNDDLAKLPREINIDYKMLNYLIGHTYGMGIGEADIVMFALQKAGLDLAKLDRQVLRAYSMSILGTPVINFAESTLSGGVITVTKMFDHFDEKDLLKMMGQGGLTILRGLKKADFDMDRANEIVELLGLHKIRSSKSVDFKITAIIKEIDLIMTENKWNIRNVELSDRVVVWIAEFLRTGNLAALTNFCKFKVMTHNSDPIYSLNEEPL